MRILYQIGIFFYGFLIKTLSVFGHKKAKLFISGRSNQKNTLQYFDKNKRDKLYWFHCASLGEYEQGKPLMEHYKKQGVQLLVTFFSPSGFEERKDDSLIDYVFYLPLDSKKNAKNFINNIKPDKAFFIKYEVWPNYFNALKNQNIPLYLVSSTFRENQIYFKWYGKWFLKALKNVTHFFLQDESSAQLLNKYGFKNTVVTGDTRFDNVYESAKMAQENIRLKNFSQEKPVLILGSSWPIEEQLAAKIYKELESEFKFKLIIVPHDVSESHINQIEKMFKTHQPHLYSDASDINSNVLIIDSIGVLRNAYQYADIAFVGGGFKNALHNILEPLVFGLPVLFGDNHAKFSEADKLIQHGVAFDISDANELKKILIHLLDEDELRKISAKADAFVKSNLGSTNKIKAIELGEKQF